ncbi:unnamed protein product [Allacma fusca]|uniref:Uncharacterized protein n=1 Tax=Allacma fusca TaxID=39272 RepID=A0A8J2NX30_9HEXA|nr:unnamed protein product [Allacma fusca]
MVSGSRWSEWIEMVRVDRDGQSGSRWSEWIEMVRVDRDGQSGSSWSKRYIDCIHCTSSGSQWVKLLNQTQCCSSNLSKLDALFVSVTSDEKDCPIQLNSNLSLGMVLASSQENIEIATSIELQEIELHESAA